ncbi:hypothetical protein MIMGU_mgv1a017485mg [Erythranthe guttata]|uniref:Uncharacterized protein n=1 Tax=Erythranthe guttata TaxID=4155 RepID=A0A022R3F6_ERYGU|nr:hypothetical protein MIMGU_mgv1a017485mg [Erythranthe guttata]
MNHNQVGQTSDQESKVNENKNRFTTIESTRMHAPYASSASHNLPLRIHSPPYIDLSMHKTRKSEYNFCTSEC